MSDKNIRSDDIKELYKVLLKLKTVEDCELLFEDLCTNKEIEQMASRIKAAKMLIEGNTYNGVIEKTDISSATLSRVSRCVKYGKGYTKFLK
ncbi:MAG TPA: TrpR-related protein YerC/YecD [Ruminococcaceae bacterium]|nr:TrpR-related protein YerC/YecD [Oscillospiraceae bacterium]